MARFTAWRAFLKSKDIAGYVYQIECCSTTARIHIQAYVGFHKAVYFSALKKALPSAHIEAARGTRRQNLKYCSKDDTRCTEAQMNAWCASVNTPPVTSGPYWSHKDGDRQWRLVDTVTTSNLAQAAQLVADGATDRQVAQRFPTTFVQSHRGLQALRMALGDSRTPGPVYVSHLWGTTGMGKTHGAVAYLRDVCKLSAEEYFIWSPKGTGNWWDGYQGQDYVIIDELDVGSIPIDQLLRITDTQGLPFRVPVHGGQMSLRAHNFIITSNKPLEQLYPLSDRGVSIEQLDALRRRVTHSIPTWMRSLIRRLKFGHRENAVMSWLRDPEGEISVEEQQAWFSLQDFRHPSCFLIPYDTIASLWRADPSNATLWCMFFESEAMVNDFISGL